ncbi:MAG TPA: hypothetical protein VGP85_02510 [Pyrinomonadaceae bacterium]|jgi:hypothetical protein|nr:hypothetical protein [Pyrinomonadaceae bacterium]
MDIEFVVSAAGIDQELRVCDQLANTTDLLLLLVSAFHRPSGGALVEFLAD